MTDASLTICLSLPDVLKGDKVFVHKRLVDFRQDVDTLRHLPEHSVDSIQVVQVLPHGDEELE